MNKLVNNKTFTQALSLYQTLREEEGLSISNLGIESWLKLYERFSVLLFRPLYEWVIIWLPL